MVFFNRRTGGAPGSHSISHLKKSPLTHPPNTQKPRYLSTLTTPILRIKSGMLLAITMGIKNDDNSPEVATLVKSFGHSKYINSINYDNMEDIKKIQKEFSCKVFVKINRNSKRYNQRN